MRALGVQYTSIRGSRLGRLLSFSLSIQSKINSILWFHLQDPSSKKFRPYKSKFIRAAEAEAAVHAKGSSVFSETGSNAGSATSASSYSVSGYQSLMSNQTNDKAEVGVRVGMITPQNQNPQKSSTGHFINQNQKPSQIVLKGKLGLPEGFGPLKPYQKLLAKNEEDNDSLGMFCSSVWEYMIYMCFVYLYICTGNVCPDYCYHCYLM